MKPSPVFKTGSWIATLAISLCFKGLAASDPLITFAGSNWTFRVNTNRPSLAIEHRLWGTVLADARFLTGSDKRQGEERQEWNVVQDGPGRLVIRIVQPRMTWVLEGSDTLLKISCTSPEALINGTMPVTTNRSPARLLDSSGTPVVWQGTGEVAGGYGGTYTRHSSFLPSRNSTCMYFALGLTDGSIFHSLFDRQTDVALSFSDETILRRARTNEQMMDVSLPVRGSTIIHLQPDYFTKVLGTPYYVPFDDSRFSHAPAVWCSWTSYYGDVTEDAVVHTTDWLAENLKPYGFQYVQIDDGYDRGLKEGHYWVEHWDRRKFPHGPQWLTAYIKSKGLHPGLWLVPNAYAGAVKDHPDWYLRDKSGGIVRDYDTPALDSTNPEVLAFLTGLFAKLKNWGFEYYKFDGEYAMPQYVPAVDHSRLHDPGADPLVVYRQRLKTIREAIGPETFVEGCPAGTPLNGIGFFNWYFNGQDVYNNWNGMHALLSSINANTFLNHIVVYVMSGEGMELGRPMSVEEAQHMRSGEVVETARSREEPLTGLGVTSAEARTLVSVVSLSGVVYPLASVTPELPAERLQLLQSTLPPMPILPLDLFSRGTDVEWDTFKHIRADDYIHHYPEVLDLKVNAASGVYDVVALPNWRSWPSTKTVSFANDLGLDAQTSFVVFDFWNRKLLGIFRDRLAVDVEGHDTRVLLIHPLLDHPQFLGTSRHISGAFSVRDLSWDASKALLRGSAETIPDAPYTVYIHVPQGVSVLRARALAGSTTEIPIKFDRQGELLTATFLGQKELVRWELGFSSR